MRKSIHVEIPRFKGSFYPHEWEILNSTTQFNVVVAHRRARKTTTILNKALLEGVRRDKKPGMLYVVFPTSTLARDVIWRDPNQVFRVIPDEVIERVQEVEMNIHLKTGSVIAIRGSDQIDRLTGTGGRFYALDEYSLMKPEVWEQAVYPILKQNKGSALLSGTPRGKNHFYEAFQKGNDANYPNWKSFYYPASKTKVFDEPALEQMKLEMSERLFNQEILCEWLSSEGVVFRGVKECATALPRKPRDGGRYLIGVDLARLQDYTALSVWDWDTNENVYLERIQKLDWTVQSDRIALLAQKYNDALCIVESNSIGDAVVDLLQRKNVAVEPFKTSHVSKKEMIEKLGIYIESKKIRLLKDPVLIEELESYGYSLTPLGNVQYSAMAGHDDTVIATALACTKLFPTFKDPPVQKPPSLIRQHRDRVIYNQEHGNSGDPFDVTEWW